MLSPSGNKKVAELKVFLKESEALVLQTLKDLGLTYEEFILLTNNPNKNSYLN